MPCLHDDYIYQQVTVKVGFWKWIKCKARFTLLSIFLQIDDCPFRLDKRLSERKTWLNHSIQSGRR